MTTFINHYVFDVLVVVAYYELYVIFIAADLTKPSLLIFKVNNAVELHCVGTVLVNREGGIYRSYQKHYSLQVYNGFRSLAV